MNSRCYNHLIIIAWCYGTEALVSEHALGFKHRVCNEHSNDFKECNHHITGSICRYKESPRLFCSYWDREKKFQKQDFYFTIETYTFVKLYFSMVS